MPAIVRSLAMSPSDLGLLRHLEGVFDFNAEVAHCTFQLGMSEQQLHRSTVLRPPVDQRSLGASHGVGAVRSIVESDRCDPPMNHPGILSCRQMRRRTQSAWE